VLREIAGHPVEVVEVGEGRPVLFLHGFPLDHRGLLRSVGPVFERRRGYRRFHVDLPGFGSSPAAQDIGSTDDVIEFILGLIDEWIADQRFLLVGESWGGHLVRAVIRERPEQVIGMALIVPMTVPDHAARRTPPQATLVEEPGLLASLDPADAVDFMELAVIADRPAWDYYDAAVLAPFAAADPETTARIEAHYGSSRGVDDAPPFDGPSLIVVGRQDSAVGYTDALALVERFPRSTFAILDAAGHNLSGERRGLLAALMDDWLDRVEAEA